MRFNYMANNDVDLHNLFIYSGLGNVGLMIRRNALVNITTAVVINRQKKTISAGTGVRFVTKIIVLWIFFF